VTAKPFFSPRIWWTKHWKSTFSYWSYEQAIWLLPHQVAIDSSLSVKGLLLGCKKKEFSSL